MFLIFDTKLNDNDNNEIYSIVDSKVLLLLLFVFFIVDCSEFIFY